jgi:hypothetical protein
MLDVDEDEFFDFIEQSLPAVYRVEVTDLNGDNGNDIIINEELYHRLEK